MRKGRRGGTAGENKWSLEGQRNGGSEHWQEAYMGTGKEYAEIKYRKSGRKEVRQYVERKENVRRPR